LPLLLGRVPDLLDKVGTDFRFAHMGGVDTLFFLQKHLDTTPPKQTAWYLALTPGFTAQWGGVLLKFNPG